MNLPQWIETWLENHIPGGAASALLAKIILAAAVLVVSLIVFWLARRLVRMLVHRLFDRTRTTWDDRLQENRLFMRATLFIPALIIHLFLPAVLGGYERAIAVGTGVLNIYFIFVGVLVLDALINWLHDVYQSLRVAREIPLRAFVQVLKILLFGAGLIMAVSVVLNRSPVYLLSGLGAMTAVLMLVFKDPILGFAAGVQLISNRMLKNGDWIEMPKYGADGAVLDITLTTVKVQNWDNTITTIPTYALINDAFKNWRGMEESQGRRIKRALYIDMNSICFCTPEMLADFADIGCLADYLEQKERAIAQHNTDLGDQAAHAVNTRRLTNIGTFRAYADAYLRSHPMINTAMTLMVRQLPPGAYGLPLEIYAFCKDKAWVNYESVQADIFDHLLAIAGEFGLKVYQNPTGADIQSLRIHPEIVKNPRPWGAGSLRRI